MTGGLYDHVRTSPDAPIPPGIYRVVGTGKKGVTLLRVADIRGRRVHSGEIEHVERGTLATFEPADNPDAGVSVSALFEPVTAYGAALRYWLGI